MEANLAGQEFALLGALRAEPNRSLDELAASLGLPQTNFGRRLSHGLPEHVSRLVGAGLVERRDRRYRLTEKGRRALADRALARIQ
jgi:DNA-binding MarR family transcriptional regulator